MTTVSNKEDKSHSSKNPGRDTAFWAKGAPNLHVSNVPEGAVNLNVEGRRLTSPIQGFGRMWQKSYRIVIPGVTGGEVMAALKRDFPTFWPDRNWFYGPITGIAPGDVALLNLTMPGRVKLSTGVMVLYADDESFTLMTPEGHMFAGWITFTATDCPEGAITHAQVLARANDPLYELGLLFGVGKLEDRHWEHTLRSLAAHFGADVQVDSHYAVVDKKRQWKNFANIKHNAGIHSMLYTLAAPFRLAAKPFRRPGRPSSSSPQSPESES